MRLLARNARGQFQLTSDLRDEQVPRYAILSHTWGSEEVLYQDLTNHTGANKLGWDKIRFCADQAALDGISYFWVDTCCIDKTSHTELSEAIISMFRWYQNATKCYVYLADVSIPNNLDPADKLNWELSFHNSRWFTRGWTLQELLAPRSVEFFSREGVRLGDRTSLRDEIHHITKIPHAALEGSALSKFGIEERMKWAKNRETTRKEDRAYSLQGIFNVQMSIMYGEGKQSALRRLWREINRSPVSSISTITDTARSNSHRQRNSIFPGSDAPMPGRESTGDSGNAPPSKRRNMGSVDGSEASTSQATGNINKDIKQSLIKDLYFAQIDERLTSLSQAQGETCRWFLAKTEYTAWRNVSQQPDGSGFLWIKGNPGTGKSTLMKLLVEKARSDSRGDASQITLSFFFLARGAMEEKSITGLYRSLLHQLFSKASDMTNSLEWMTPDGARGIAQNGWHKQALNQTLKHAISMLGNRTLTIFVDALDECDQSQALGMVSFFEELCREARESKIQLRICFSSRHYPTIRIKDGAEITLEDEDGHRNDILYYTRSNLRLRQSREAESLILEISEKSSGIFLWVVLVLDILNTEYPNKSVSIIRIRNRLKEIPEGLKDLFEMILRRNGDDMERLQACLRWILFAARPLKPQELYFAVELGLNKEDPGLWDENDIDPDEMNIFVRTCSKGLAEVTHNQASIVQLIHESVRDYLLDRFRTQWSGDSGNVVGHCHDMLRDCCLAQLNDHVEQKVTPLGLETQQRRVQDVKEEVLSRFPFFEYSVLFILHHADVAEQCGKDQADFLANFPLSRWVLFRNLLEKQPIRRYTESVSLLYILAEKNLANLIRTHPRAKFYLDVENERYGTPLFAALATNSRKAIESFADVQSDVKANDSLSPGVCMQFTENMKRCTRLQRTFVYSHSKSVLSYIKETKKDQGFFSFFVNAGLVKANTPCWRGLDALSFTSERGFENVVTVLLSSGSIDIESKNANGKTALSLAAQHGHENTVQRLLESGAHIESKDELGQTPLCLAIKHGRDKTVQLLLENGADIESKDDLGRTLLLQAITQHAKKKVIKALLDNGAKIESKDELGRTLLLQAITQHADQEAITTLLNNSADIESKDYEGRTLLLQAIAQHADKEAIKTLLNNGANIESKDYQGRTLLSQAIVQHLDNEIIQRLLDHNANLESRDNLGDTPLILATKHASMSIVQQLLDHGANVRAANSLGETSFYWAVRQGPGIVKLLLDNGARLDMKMIEDGLV